MVKYGWKKEKTRKRASESERERERKTREEEVGQLLKKIFWFRAVVHQGWTKVCHEKRCCCPVARAVAVVQIKKFERQESKGSSPLESSRVRLNCFRLSCFLLCCCWNRFCFCFCAVLKGEFPPKFFRHRNGLISGSEVAMKSKSINKVYFW